MLRFILFFFFFSQFLLPGSYGQCWKFIKEKEGIKIYTKNCPNSSLKYTRGEATFRAPVEKVCALIANANNTDWWDKDIHGIKILGYEANRYIQYYFTYTLPWPVCDRDLVAESRISTDPQTGIRTVIAKPIPNAVPDKPGLVRINNYWQKWIIRPLEHGEVHVTLEGFVDPGGSIPAWLYNLFLTEAPLKTIRLLRERAQSPKPVRN
jgi:hypothetical protein